MTFAEIKAKAKLEWETLRNSTCILVSTATCGRAAGAMDVVEALNKELTRQGLEVPIIRSAAWSYVMPTPWSSSPSLTL